MLTIRKLEPGHDSGWAGRIHELIAIEAAKGNMLLRPLEEIQARITAGQVVGAFADGLLVGHCFWHAWPDDGIEICGLVVAKEFRRQGIGTSLIRETSCLARRLRPAAQIFCLADASSRQDTAINEFAAAGFQPAAKDRLPNAVWEWCPADRCPDWLAGKFPNCKCLAMVWQG